LKKNNSYLSDHYEELKDQNKDFRNSNLNKLVYEQLTGSTVLDVGAGTGHFLNFVSRQAFQGYGVEPDKKLIELSKKLYPKAKFELRCEPAHQISYNKKFDNITIIDVLEHIKKDKNTLLHLKKFLKTSGKLIIVVPAHKFLYGTRDKNMGHYRRYSKNGLIQLVKNCGLEILNIRHWNALGVLPYFIMEKIFKKPLKLQLRKKESSNQNERIISRFLYEWVEKVENKIDFHFGLSLLCVAGENFEQN